METLLRRKGILELFDHFFERNVARWGYAAIIAGLLIVFIKFHLGFIFESSDDYAVLFSVAGYYTGHPYPEISFMNYLFTQMFCLLYTACNWIPWYGLYFLGIHWVSGTIFIYSIFAIGSRIHVSKLWLVLFAVVLSFGLLLFPMHRMQFTATAGLIGAAAILLLLTADWNRMSKRENTVLYILSVFCLFLSYLQRAMSGKVAIAFWMVALCYHLFQQKFVNRCKMKQVLTRLAGAMGLFLVLMGVTLAANYYYAHYGDNAEYIQSGYNSYRAEFQDYIRPNVTFDEVQDIAESVGWDQDMWDMLYSMFYFDSRWNFETVKQFVDTYQATVSVETQSFLKSAFQAVRNTIDFVQSNQSILFLVFVQILSLVVLIWAFFSSPRQRWADLLAGLASFGAGLLLVVYLSFSGRLILRAAQSVLIPASFLTIGVVLTTLSHCISVRADLPDRQIKEQKNRLIRICAFAGAALVLVSLEIPIYTSLLSGQDGNATAKRCLKTIEEYAIDNPKNIYIYDFSFGGDPAAYYPFTVYTDPPTNLLPHGGWTALTTIYQQQLALNALDDFNAEDYLKDNVYFLTRNPKENPKQNFHTLLRYLDHMLGNVYAETVAVLADEVYVIQFRQSNTKNDTELLPGYSCNLEEFRKDTASESDGEQADQIVALYVDSHGSLQNEGETPDSSIQYWVNLE